MDRRIEDIQVTDDRLTKAHHLLVKPTRKGASPLWALVASTVMAGAACALVWAMLLGPQADMTHLQPVSAGPVQAQVLVATEGR